MREPEPGTSFAKVLIGRWSGSFTGSCGGGGGGNRYGNQRNLFVTKRERLDNLKCYMI